MAQSRGEQGQGGLLIRGSDGSLWFMRNDAAAPVKLEEDLAKSITSLLGKQPPQELSGLNPDAQKLLGEAFDIPDFWGIIVWLPGGRLRR
jgi:hypothetical protein